MDMTKIKELAQAFADNLVVPFIGAGASFPHLKLDWDSLSRRMDAETGYGGGDNLLSAQHFVDKFGKDSLCRFLKDHLLIDQFEDDVGEIYLFLLSMNCYYYYTTNQDNVFEKCFSKYNRRCSIISDIGTFKTASPNHPTIVRFHGDLEFPDTVVFTKDDYRKRMLSTQEVKSLCPLDIRLLSDSISKTLLFLGYSFRDPNIEELFQHVSALFGHNPPDSYLVEYWPDPSFEKRMADRFKITCINPVDLFPTKSADVAYRMVISELARMAMEARSALDLKELFEPGDFSVIPIVMPFEVDRFGDYLETSADSVSNRLSKFRATFDARNIPNAKQGKVRDYLIKIIGQVDKREDYQQLIGAFMNINHLDPGSSIEILAEYLCALERYPVSDPFDSIQVTNVHMRAIPSQFNIIAVARCFELMLERKGSVPTNILGHVSHMVQSRRDLEQLDEAGQQYVQALFMRSFGSSQIYSNPLTRASLSLSTPRFEDIVSQMSSILPKRPSGPKS